MRSTDGRATRARTSRPARAVAAIASRPQDWADRQDAASHSGVAVDWWRRYRAIEGPLQSILLTAYVFLAVFPAMLVLDEYLQRDPAALTNHIVSRYGLSSATADTLRGVLFRDETHKLGTAVIAIGGALLFGLGFGRVLQLVYARTWRIELKSKATDQGRYAVVLLVLVALVVLLLVQTTELAGTPAWDEDALAFGWFALLVGYFVWAPRLLTHRQISARDLLPGAALTAFGIVALFLVSSFLLATWIDFYSKDYGGLGVVMALFFWLGFGSTIIVASASLAPALAGRRELLRARAADRD